MYTHDGRRRQGYEEIKAAEEQPEGQQEEESRVENYEYQEGERVDAAEEYEYYGDEYGDEYGGDYGVYGVSEGAYLPSFANEDGGLAIGANE